MVYIVDAEGMYPEEKTRTNPKNRMKLAKIADELIKSRIAEMLSIPNSAVVISKDRAGAPYLPGYHGIHISKSYTGRYAGCAVSTDAVGIDIEKLRSPNYSIAKRHFCKSELEQVFQMPTPTKENFLAVKDDIDICKRWTRLWTVKEAYGKYLGTGLSGIRWDALSTAGVCARRNLELVNIPIDEGVVCTVVSPYSDASIVRINWRAMLDMSSNSKA